MAPQSLKLVCLSYGAMTADAQVHTLLRFGNVAAVHHLPAGLPRTCGLKYLLSMIMALSSCELP